MNTTVTHKNLKKQFDIYNETNEIDGLLLELEFSTLLLPASFEDEHFCFSAFDFDGETFVLVFTDIHEVEKADLKDKYDVMMPNPFEVYLDMLDKYDGIMIDVAGECFPVTRKFRDMHHPKCRFGYERKTFTADEIRKVMDSADNRKLDEFLSDPSLHWDHEKLIDIMMSSDLLAIVGSEEDLSEYAENGVIHLKDTLPWASDIGNGFEYMAIFSSPDEINVRYKGKMYPYLQLVNLPEMIQAVLLEDMDGIVLNRNSHNITIPRRFLMEFFRDFSTPNTAKYDDYAFLIE